MTNMLNVFKKNIGLLIVLLLSFWAVQSLFIPGFFPIHDDTQVARVFEMNKALKDGMFPVRWVSDLGYGFGYPIFNYYAPLAYYIGGVIQIMGFDALMSTKIMMATGIILAGVFMYFLGKNLWGEFGGVIAGTFYVYVPYHAVEIYVRGDVSEFWAYALIPLVFYSIFMLFKKTKKRFIISGGLGYAGLILSHNLTAMMVTPFLLALIIYLYFFYSKDKKVFFLQLLVILIGLLLSAFYWIPALFEMKYTNIISQIGGGADFRNHFVCLGQLWNSPWGFGGSIPGCLDGLSFKIGKLHLVSALITVFLGITLLMKKKQYQEKILLIIFSFLGFIISVFFMLDISKSIWEIMPAMAFFQYPWRFLLITSFFSSFLAGGLIWVLQTVLGKLIKYNFIYYFIGLTLIVLLTLFNYKIFWPQTIFSKTASDYTNEFSLLWDASKTSDEYMPKDFSKPQIFNDTPKHKLLVQKETIGISNLIEKTQRVSATLNIKKNTTLDISIAYFPAWKVFVDGAERSFSITNKGLNIPLSSGLHKIDIRFEQTLIEKIANLLSLAGIITLIIGIIYSPKKALNK